MSADKEGCALDKCRARTNVFETVYISIHHSSLTTSPLIHHGYLCNPTIQASAFVMILFVTHSLLHKKHLG